MASDEVVLGAGAAGGVISAVSRQSTYTKLPPPRNRVVSREIVIQV